MFVSRFRSWFQICCTCFNHLTNTVKPQKYHVRRPVRTLYHFHYIYDFAAQRRRQTTRWAGVIRSTRSFTQTTLGNILMLRKQDNSQTILCCSRFTVSPPFNNSSIQDYTELLEFTLQTFCGREYNVKSFINASDRGNHRGAGFTRIKPEQTSSAARSLKTQAQSHKVPHLVDPFPPFKTTFVWFS